MIVMTFSREIGVLLFYPVFLTWCLILRNFRVLLKGRIGQVSGQAQSQLRKTRGVQAMRICASNSCHQPSADAP
jgi:hypothetical protein